MKEKIKAYFAGLPAADFDCFDSFTGGGYVDFAPASQEFYQTIIDARKSVIGG
jgi:phosphonate transport system substrate-binding protein